MSETITYTSPADAAQSIVAWVVCDSNVVLDRGAVLAALLDDLSDGRAPIPTEEECQALTVGMEVATGAEVPVELQRRYPRVCALLDEELG